MKQKGSGTSGAFFVAAVAKSHAILTLFLLETLVRDADVGGKAIEPK